MRGKKIGWFVGSLGLLLGAGAAWGNEVGGASSSKKQIPQRLKPHFLWSDRHG